MIKKNLTFSLYAFFFLTIINGCTSQVKNEVKTGGPEVISFQALPFDLNRVKLLDGPFLHATDLDISTLLEYEPDRLLSGFYSEAGLKPKAERYGGWESESLAGHSLGHYLSACAMMYRSTGDRRFLERAAYIVSELKHIQDETGSGYLGAFPDGKKVFEEQVAKGSIRSRGFDLNGIWSPFYTHHKVLAGLRDAYRFCGDTTALKVEKKFAGWIGTIVNPLTDEQTQEMLKCEHGGIAETLADLYADTGDREYLGLAGKFYHREILDAFKERKDVMPGKHGNTNIPKLIALSRIYELTGDTSDRNAAEFFWKTVTANHSYVTGGNGDNEYFGQPGKLRNRLDEGTTETCNVYNMLKLTSHLFEYNTSVAEADFYERALFNHILASQNPADGHVTYNLSLDMGGYKAFQDPGDFTCCIGTGMENHSKYGENIYYHNDNELFLFQYIASELDWKEKGVVVKMTTGFPAEQGAAIEMKCEKPVRFALMVRYPYWAKEGVEVRVNGKKQKVKQLPGSFVAVERTWKSGDVVNINLPFTLRLESMPDDSNRVAVMYGPLVLAGDLGPVNDTASRDAMYVPVLMTARRDPSAWLKPVEGKVNTFMTVNTGRPRDVELRPFYTIYDRRYTIYWDLFDEKGWETKKAEYTAALEMAKKLKDAEIDFVQPGEMQPERNHNFNGEKTTPGGFKERANRESRGGWFSFRMKVLPDIPVSVVAEYWGGFPGAKTFDIEADGKVIATENISNKKDGEFITVQYDIPESVTKGKTHVTVTFRAHQNNTAGPLFGLRTIRKL